MKVDGKALERAIARVAEKRFAAELREAVVYGPAVLGEVFKAYEEECDKRNRRAGRVIAVVIWAVIAGMVAIPPVAYLHGLGRL